jgi:CBS domain-containing protein
MTKKPLTAGPETTVAEARRFLQSHRIRHLPVVDGAGDLLGMLSDRDLLKSPQLPEGATEVDVTAVMTPHPIVVDVDADLEEALDIMLESGIGALPVLDRDGKLAGIVSYGHLTRALAGLPAA